MNRIIRIGTDCSGIEAPVQALKNLKVEFEHVFSSEKDTYARKSLEANYTPKHFYTDIKEREFHEVDIYACGFPCQPFSMAGLRKGTEDPRGQIFEDVLTFIKNARPKTYILENVKGLLSTDYWNYIISSLKEIEGYSVNFKVLNTKDYGLPQSRNRIYIVGTLNGSFIFPKGTEMKNINDFIDYTDTSGGVLCPSVAKKMDSIGNTVFCNAGSIRPNGGGKLTSEYCNTITCSSLWNIKMKRQANVKEYLALQGFPEDFNKVVSNTQLKKQAGNAMSVCVVQAIIQSLILNHLEY